MKESPQMEEEIEYATSYADSGYAGSAPASIERDDQVLVIPSFLE